MKKLLLCLAVLLLMSPAFAQGGKPVIGVMPVFDSSGDATGEIFTQNLTFMIFQELRAAGMEPVLLNPGGLYNPIYSDWISDFADVAHVSSVLVTTLQPLDKPKRGDWTLQVDAQIMNLAGNKTSPTVPHRYSLERRDVEVEYAYHARWFDTGASRPFAKQPLGKAAQKIAREIRDQVNAAPDYLASGPAPVPVPSSASTCDVDFKVVYKGKNAISKSYGVVINGREQSLGMREGIVPLAGLKDGPIVVHVTVNDAPYKLPVQKLYQANDVLNCASRPKALNLEIGPAGEALLKWEQ